MSLRPSLFKREPAEPGLSEEEWKLDFDSKTFSYIEVVAMLNYEYARSCHLMRSAVSKLKKKPNLSAPAFARFLAKHFPEFPKASWLKIPKKTRTDRLAALWIDDVVPQHPADSNAIEIIEIDEFLDAAQEAEIFQDDYLILKVDWSAKILSSQLKKLFEDRRLELHNKYPNNNKVQKCFEPTKVPKSSGRKAYPQPYHDVLRSLGYTRLLSFHEFDWKKAEDAAAFDLNDVKSWKRNVAVTTDLMTRFLAIWKLNYRPADVLLTKNFFRLPGLSVCCRPLIETRIIE